MNNQKNPDQIQGKMAPLVFVVDYDQSDGFHANPHPIHVFWIKIGAIEVSSSSNPRVEWSKFHALSHAL